MINEGWFTECGANILFETIAFAERGLSTSKVVRMTNMGDSLAEARLVVWSGAIEIVLGGITARSTIPTRWRTARWLSFTRCKRQ
jgi:hypothetical protein